MNWEEQPGTTVRVVTGRTIVLIVVGLYLGLAFAGGVGIVGAQDSTSGLTVQNVSTNSPVVAGESINVTAEITNEGRTAYSQDIDLAIDGRLTDSTAVTLEPGDTRMVDLTWDTTADAVGSHSATVSSENDTAGVDVVVEGTAGPFTVGIVSTHSPVVEGDDLVISSDITNEGSAAGSQEIELTIGGRVTDSTTVSLDSGQTQTVDLTWATGSGDGGNYTARVATPNDTAETDVTVEEPAGSFTVGAISTNSPVVEGDVLTVTANVTNQAGVQASQEVTLAIDGNLTDRTTVSLDAGQTQTVDLTWETGPGDAGTFTANVSTTDDSGETEVQVESDSGSADLIRIYTQPTNTTVGNPISGPPTAEVTDTFGNPVPNVTVEVSLTADAGSALFGTLSMSTNDEGRATFDDLVLDALGSYQLVFRVPEHSLERNSTTFAVIDDTAPSASITGPDTVPVGEEIQLDASGSSDNVEIARYRWDFGDGTMIEGEELTQPTHTYSEAGAYVVAVTVVDTSGNQDTASLTVSSEGNVCSGHGECSVEITGTNAPVRIGDREAHNVEINATVRNTGARPGNQTITLSVGSIQRDTQEVELPVGESRHLTLHWAVTEDDIGNYSAVVSASNYSDSRPVRVTADTASPTVGPIKFVPCTPVCDGDPIVASENDPTPEKLTRGQSYRVSADASDTDGSVESYEWTIDGEPVSSAETFEHSFAESGQHEVSLRVTDEDGGTATTSVTVEANAPPAVSITISPDQPVVGESTTFEATASDPDGDDDALQYEWDFGNGRTATGSGDNNPYDVPGNKTITLAVTDEDGGTTTIERTIEVQAAGGEDPDLEQAIDIEGLSSPVEVGEERTLTADATDPDGNITVESYEWTVDGEPAGSGPSISYTFDSSGEHQVAVTVTDENGATAIIERTVTVEQAGNDGPGGILPILFGLIGGVLLLAGLGYYSYKQPTTATGSQAAQSSGTVGDDEDSDSAETIFDPEPGEASDGGEGDYGHSTQSSTFQYRTDDLVGEGGENAGEGGAVDSNPPTAMTTAELIDSIASEADITKATARDNMDAFIDTTTTALKKGNRVTMAGIGTFDPMTQAGTAEGDTASRDLEISFTPSPDLVSALGHIGPGGSIDPETVDDSNAGAATESETSEGTDVIYGKYAGTEYADTPYLSHEERAAAISALVASTANALAAGQAVEFGDLGRLYPERGQGADLQSGGDSPGKDAVKRGDVAGRQPSGSGSGTGSSHDAAAAGGVKFKPGAELSDKIK